MVKAGFQKLNHVHEAVQAAVTQSGLQSPMFSALSLTTFPKRLLSSPQPTTTKAAQERHLEQTTKARTMCMTCATTQAD